MNFLINLKKQKYFFQSYNTNCRKFMEKIQKKISKLTEKLHKKPAHKKNHGSWSFLFVAIQEGKRHK